MALILAALVIPLAVVGPGAPPRAPYAEIRAVDAVTGRGVPLVEFETTHHVRFVTDNAGRVAFYEPGLMDRPVFFHVRSHGYTVDTDGFGFAGTRLTLHAGSTATVRLQRINIAERLYRITGQGLYRDSVLLGYPTPLAAPLGTAEVAGQDSAFALPYRGRIWWFWGDTARLRYPLGHFAMAAATSDRPGPGGLDPERGIDLRYRTDAAGFSRPVCRLDVKRGMVWADAFVVLPDAQGREQLVCHYAHMASLRQRLGHGLARWDDEQEAFARIVALPAATAWCWPGQAHPVRWRDGNRPWLLLGEAFPTVRVPADIEHVIDPCAYEAFSCLAPGASADNPAVLRDAAGRLRWRWCRDAPPVDSRLEARLLDAGLITPAEARYSPQDVDGSGRILLVRGSVNWNPDRRRWILIAGQQGGTSNLGEIWYAEATRPTGPWPRAKKIVTHDRYSFYNPVHHRFLDADGGRIIYFEGTYVTTFSGNPTPTPRYDYNQILYRLDLADPRLAAVSEVRPETREPAPPSPSPGT